MAADHAAGRDGRDSGPRRGFRSGQARQRRGIGSARRDRAGGYAEPAAPVTPEVPAPAEPAPAEDQSSRARPGAKKNAKARRSSVPSWDEIMLGSSRQRD